MKDFLYKLWDRILGIVARKKVVRITVTKEDILKGVPKSIAVCPIGLAAQRALKGFDKELLIIGSKNLQIRDTRTNNIELVRMVSPFDNISVDKFVHRFDRNSSVEPFSFRIFI